MSRKQWGHGFNCGLQRKKREMITYCILCNKKFLDNKLIKSKFCAVTCYEECMKGLKILTQWQDKNI